MKFPCKSCGACCRRVPEVSGLDRGDGACRYYDDNSRQCTVYDTRPVLCQVDKSFALLAEKGRISANTFYMTQALSCTLMDPDNHDMPQRTADALRAEGLYDEAEHIDAEAVKRTSALLDELLADTGFQLSPACSSTHA